MTPQQILDLIRIFHAVVPEGLLSAYPVEVNRMAMKAGYIVDPKACTEGVFDAMKEASNNYKTTFYHDFEEVISRTRFDLFVDQMLHYMSTYGTNYRAKAFTCNPTPEAMAYKELVPVRAVTAKEMYDLCNDLISTGSALKLSTLTPVVDYVAAYLRDPENISLRAEYDIAAIDNSEARCMLYAKMRELPDDPIEFLRVAVYSATGSPMLIRCRESLDIIRENACNSLRCIEMFGSQLSDKQKESLASVYFRFSDFFISFKQSFASVAKDSPYAEGAVKLINYLRHMAPRCKKPFRVDMLSEIINYIDNPDSVRRAVASEVSTFRLVRILGYLRMMASDPSAVQYTIRNGKTFIRSIDSYSRYSTDVLQEIVTDEIVARLRKKVSGKTIRFPESFSIAAPSSEKNFVGDMPFLTSYDMGRETFIGVYWRNEWGTHDFDLSYISSDGVKIGWNADFKDANSSVIFSGDMTNADPEAAEILYFRKKVTDGYVFVNRYNGIIGSRFRLFFGKGKPLMAPHDGFEDPCNPSKGMTPGDDFQVSQMDIRLEADAESNNTQQLVGFVYNGRFYFMTFGMGEAAVSGSGQEYPLYEALVARTSSAVDLRELLLSAGAVEYRDDRTATVPDIDLSSRKLDRLTILSLFRS